MQTAKNARRDISAKIIPFKTMRSGRREEQALQNETEKMSCFRTDLRYDCMDTDCDSSDECKKLIAVWMR